MVSLGPYKILNNIINKLCFPYTPKLIKTRQVLQCPNSADFLWTFIKTSKRETAISYPRWKVKLQYKKHRFLVIFILIFDISFLNTETFDDVDSM